MKERYELLCDVVRGGARWLPCGAVRGLACGAAHWLPRDVVLELRKSEMIAYTWSTFGCSFFSVSELALGSVAMSKSWPPALALARAWVGLGVA